MSVPAFVDPVPKPFSDRDGLLTEFGKRTLENRYLLPDESYQDLFMRVAQTYSDNSDHCHRIYDYISRLWFMPATPILANGGTQRGLPISCFLNETQDSLEGIVDLWTESTWLTAHGGGIGSYWGNLRSIGEKIGHNGETSGIIPFIKVMDSLILAISQGSLRRGAAAIYLPISHPEIEEFVEIRKPTGGDLHRKALNVHHGVVISDDFMKAVEDDTPWNLKSPRDHHVIRTLSARALWSRILTTRLETGEPYLLFIDTVQKKQPAHQQALGLWVKMSNLCTEITLPTGLDPWGQDRTAVCCLSSVNLEAYREWESHPTFIIDCLRFLDNVLEDFISRAPLALSRAVYSANRERSVGLGVMGFHAFLQKMGLPLESAMAKIWNKRIFQYIRTQADQASVTLAHERGPCLDAEAAQIMERFSNKVAIAPNSSTSIICGGTSPGIEPFVSNAYTHKTLGGSFPVRNKYLQALLEIKKCNTDEVWSSIICHEGSVQHLDFLSPEEKAIFKTAFEIDQRWLIEHAADRQPFICQAQSLNLFLPGNIHKRDLHQIHMLAWKKGIKSLYYTRSKTIQRAQSTYTSPPQGFLSQTMQPTLPLKYEECLACQ